MFCLNEGIEQLAIKNTVLRKQDGYVLRRELDFEIEGQRKKWRPKRT